MPLPYPKANYAGNNYDGININWCCLTQGNLTITVNDRQERWELFCISKCLFYRTTSTKEIVTVEVTGAF